ncbi:MAG: redoxin family protein [Methyloceanibacter sp.]|uniref:redoxin family protein n=1 Tax=Methyloceanibacter sp. TaxID=1965321 RepID=UPI003EDEA54C
MDGGADHAMPGMALPPIMLLATDGTNICMAGLPGRSVIAVYPWTGRPGRPNPPNWDDIPGAHGSTPELEGFRDLAARFGEQKTRLFGLSLQTTDYQRELVERLRLPFPILSDRDGAFAAALALPSFAAGGDTYLKRLTLVVREGVIERVFFPVANPARHPGEVFAGLRRWG